MINLTNARTRIALCLYGVIFLPLTPPGAVYAEGALTSPSTSVLAPAEAKQEGPPLRDGERTLFRFHAPEGTVKVFLAASFNAYANNQNGAVTDEKFAMTKAGDYFFTRSFVEPKVQQYKYVVLDGGGQYNWVSDPQVRQTDQDGNSILDFSKIGRLPIHPDQEGAPIREGEQVLFRFAAPLGTQRVYLAGSFNGYANNQNSIVTDEQFAMIREKNGLYTKRLPLGATTEKYKFVVVDKDGQSNWVADPSVQATDDEGNTVVEFGKIERLS